MQSTKPRFPWTKAVKLLLLLVILGVVGFCALVGYVCYLENEEAKSGVPNEKSDAIIVLGAQVLASGEPSVQLSLRLQAALDAYRASPTLIITCGAQGGDEPRPEADVMKDWLVAQGVPAEDVLVENTSFNTRQNIRNAIKLLDGRNASRITLITSDYHLPRAMALARDEGLTAMGIGSMTRQEYWVKNHTREALAWVKYWMQKYLHIPLE